MKFLIAFAFLAVVSALPPGHWFGHRQHEDYQVDGPSSYQNKYQHFKLIKSAYEQLIDKLNHPSQDEIEEEERAINDIVDTINIIGQIIHHGSDDGSDSNDHNRPPKPQHPEHNGQENEIPNKPPGSDKEVPPNRQEGEKKAPSIGGSENGLIYLVDELPADDESEGDEISLVDNALEEDEREHDIFSLVNQKDDEENPLIAYNSKSVVNEIAGL